MKTRTLDEALSISPNDDLNLIHFESLSQEEFDIVASSMIIREFYEGIHNAIRDSQFAKISHNTSPAEFIEKHSFETFVHPYKTIFDSLIPDATYNITDTEIGLVNLVTSSIDLKKLYEATIYFRSPTGRNEFENRLASCVLDIFQRMSPHPERDNILNLFFKGAFEMDASLRDYLGVITFSDIADFKRGIRSKANSFKKASTLKRPKKTFYFSTPSYLKPFEKFFKKSRNED